MAIRFSEGRRPALDGLTSEKDMLEIEGVRDEPTRRQWERRGHGQPAVNDVEAKRVEIDLAHARAERVVDRRCECG